MTSILNHVWGVSSASDRVWAQVSGISPSKAGEQLLVILQGFIDDSRGEDGAFVLAGYIASAENWAKFSAAWKEILPYSGQIDNNGVRYFKMSELATKSDGIERSQAFFRVIEKHALLSVSSKINIHDLRRATERIVIPSALVDWDLFANPYLFTFRCLLDGFHTHKTELVDTILPPGVNVDFILDDQAEKAPILELWNSYISRRDEKIRPLYGATPQFEDDKKFMPLQAADFWAWWVRRWYEKNEEFLRFGEWAKTKGKVYYILAIEYNEDQIVDALVAIAREHLGPFMTIIDRKTNKLL
jgi:Protein of unknown function (DUF3800)